MIMSVPSTHDDRNYANGHERRTAPRLPCAREVRCQPVMAGKLDEVPAILEDVSAAGVRLGLRRWYEPGRVLALKITDSQLRVMRTLLAHVIYARARGSGLWHIGCSLMGRLEAAEIEALV
jgi:hypothetical protein